MLFGARERLGLEEPLAVFERPERVGGREVRGGATIDAIAETDVECPCRLERAKRRHRRPYNGGVEVCQYPCLTVRAPPPADLP